ncbi:hypothetical protein [Ectothiorhodospira sp. BSL-9]|uniref:hypothetical protein n=1 Tax=Ectothiorhodospira sp. BSL-9 TaxID=1442136 RepID=UPI0035272EAB
MAIQFGHHALAKAHDLGVGTALGIESLPPLPPTDGHAGESVLEDLLKPQELDDAQVHRGANSAREPLKPAVDELEMLCPVTSRSLEAALIPVSPMLKDGMI